MKGRRGLRALGVGGATVLIVGALGWSLDGFSASDALFRALQAFTLSDAYADLSKVRAPARLWLDAARFGGAGIAFSAILLLVWTALYRRRLWLTARLSREHVVVIGATAFADRLAEATAASPLRIDVIHLRDAGQAVQKVGRLIRLPFNGFDRDGLDEVNVARASQLVIAMDDDAASIGVSILARRRHSDLSIMTRLESGLLIRNLHALPEARRLRTFSEPFVAVQDILRRHPLFLIAEDRGMVRIKVLLIGSPVWIEALLVQCLLTSRTSRFGRIEAVLCCEDSEGLQRVLSLRYPELVEEVDLRFLPLEAAEAESPVSAVNREAAGLECCTAAFVAFDDSSRSLSAALALCSVQSSGAGVAGPIFTRVQGECGLSRPTPGAKLESGQLVPFGGYVDLHRVIGELAGNNAGAERAWHAAYLKLTPSPEADRPWRDLDESYRASNRRAIAHTYAKLFDAGFDLRPWLRTAALWEDLPTLAPGEALYRTPDELLQLGALEHARWNADKRLQGWRYGESRDETLKTNPYLIAFEHLPPDIQKLDVQLIEALDSLLPRRIDGLRRS